MGKCNKKKIKARDRREIMRLERNINRICDEMISNMENRKELMHTEDVMSDEVKDRIFNFMRL